MTRLTASIPDDTLPRLQARADHQRKPLEEAAGLAITAACTLLPPGGRVVVVTGEVASKLEEILGGGSILNEADLLQKVERLAGISFLHCRLPFTPNQLEQLQERAERQGLTVEQLVDRTAPRIYEQFFNLVALV